MTDESVQPVPNHWSAFKIRHPKKRAFLSAYVQFGTVTDAAESAGIARCRHYEWRAEDSDYARAWLDAEDRYAEKLEREADRRAVEGVEEPLTYQGEVFGKVRKYSDNLLMFRLKALKPDKYRERREDRLTGPDGGALRIVIDDDDRGSAG